MIDQKPDLFARYDPLIKTLPLYKESFDEGQGGILAVRPVWIIGDLFVINEWLASDLKKTNWHLNQRRTTVMQHYKQILLSGNAQSFMVEQNSQVAIQLDVLPIRFTDYPGQSLFGQRDYAINFLYKECFRDPDLFRRCLLSMIRFIYSYPVIDRLFMRIIKSDPAMQKLLEQAGFELLDLTSFFGKSLNIYKIGRTGF